MMLSYKVAEIFFSSYEAVLAVTPLKAVSDKNIGKFGFLQPCIPEFLE